MKAKKCRTNYRRKEFTAPKPTNPEEKREVWNQRNAVARADEARYRIAQKEQSKDKSLGLVS